MHAIYQEDTRPARRCRFDAGANGKSDQCAAENSFHGFCPDAVICKGNLMVGLTNHVSDHILDRIMERINHVG